MKNSNSVPDYTANEELDSAIALSGNGWML